MSRGSETIWCCKLDGDQVGGTMAAAMRQGGDRRSGWIEAYRGAIMGLVEAEPDITLHEIADHLREAHGLAVAPSTIWRFFDRHAVTFKKNRTRQRTATA